MFNNARNVFKKTYGKPRNFCEYYEYETNSVTYATKPFI